MANEPFQPYGVGFDIRSNFPVDSRYVAQTVTLAKSEIPTSRRYKGLKVYIVNEQREYWWKSGITNADFIPYDPCGGGNGASNGSYLYVVPTESALEQLPTEGIPNGAEANVSDGTTITKYYFLNGQWVRYGEISIPPTENEQQ